MIMNQLEESIMTNMNISNENAYPSDCTQYEGLDLVPTTAYQLVEHLSPKTSESIFKTLQEAVLEGNPAVANAFYAYDRKGYISTAPVGGEINSSYGSCYDDVVLQVTVRIPGNEMKNNNLIYEITGEAVRSKAALVKEQRAEIDRQIEELQARRDSL